MGKILQLARLTDTGSISKPALGEPVVKTNLDADVGVNAQSLLYIGDGRSSIYNTKPFFSGKHVCCGHMSKETRTIGGVQTDEYTLEISDAFVLDAGVPLEIITFFNATYTESANPKLFTIHFPQTVIVKDGIIDTTIESDYFKQVDEFKDMYGQDIPNNAFSINTVNSIYLYIVNTSSSDNPVYKFSLFINSPIARWN